MAWTQDGSGGGDTGKEDMVLVFDLDRSTRTDKSGKSDVLSSTQGDRGTGGGRWRV